MTGSGKVRKKKWNDLSCLLIIFFFSLLVVEIDETRASRSCISSVKVSLFYSSFLLWWLWAWIPQCKTCPHFLWDTENAIEKALNACASSTCYSLCHWQLRQLEIFYVMQSLLISALRLIFSSLICFFKRLCCSLFYTRWRLSLVAMENDEGILFHVDQPASGSGSDERNDVRHARGKLKAYPMSHQTCPSTTYITCLGLHWWDTWPGDPLAIYFSSWSFSELARAATSFFSQRRSKAFFSTLAPRLSQMAFVVHITKET